MKQYKFIQKLLLAVLALGCASCSQDEETQVNQQNLVVLNVADTGLVSSESQTRTVDDGFVTTFTQGDQLGLFAVKDGVIMDEINNMLLTYNGSSWSGKPILYDERLEGVVFYAYYPYQADMTGKTGLQGEDFFAPLVDSWNLTNAQSDQKEYAKQDLMTSGKTELIGENGNYSLSFQLSHRMSLVVVKLPSTHYLFTDAEGTVLPEETPYIAKPNPASISFEIGEEKILPYYDAAKDEYRLLRKPSSAETITGYYNGKKCSLVTEGKMEQGKYKRFVVDGGHREKKHHLQVGDFYYADGNIVSVTDENPPVKGCIGVVYYVGKTFPSELYEGEYGDVTKDALKRDYPACNHAFVVALTDGEDERIYWETEKKSIEFGKWFETLSLQSSFFNVQIADYGIPSKFEKMLGYNNTKVIETIVKQAPGSEYINIGSLQGYRDNCLLPEMTTNWFIPSIQELAILYKNKDIVNQKLEIMQQKEMDFVLNDKQLGYWSSTEFNNQMMYAYNSKVTEKSIKEARAYKSTRTAYLRFTFAF